jgi:ribosomal protein S18 acetylase RimI-like enzyme
MSCEVTSILTVEEPGRGRVGLRLREEKLPIPYRKNYDAMQDGGPMSWPRRFDISHWAFRIALEDGHAVGAAAIAWNTPGIDMLGDPPDEAVLWDLRVAPSRQRRGIGTALFQEAATSARTRQCRFLKVETQNVNVAACRFYSHMGCFLGRMDRLAYRHVPEAANEIMLVWYLDLLRPFVAGEEAPAHRQKPLA